ncbi:hypothetical protein [Nitrosovibrio tenuis]|uniref:Uncharacterized protein n=1 Tax=Nitrosovibrio tenuis TaxID=1233 RepID=A0A1H7MBT6_9PROT|nr:hypothetical protein [Nitrosovibrio tenuis]SEL08780.1 hypothetical protein SAMN05216387_10518 [Nitrosovibrio tenuis]
MKKYDHDLFDFAFALLDHRSEAFRQKMFKHFQSTGRRLWTDVEKIPGRKRNEPISHLEGMNE